MRLGLVFVLILVFAAPFASANETLEALKADQPMEAGTEEAEAEAEEQNESLDNPYSSVNISEEYGFESRQNVDSFLGDVYNPAAPLASDNTYKGSRSEMRKERDDRLLE